VIPTAYLFSAAARMEIHLDILSFILNSIYSTSLMRIERFTLCGPQGLNEAETWMELLVEFYGFGYVSNLLISLGAILFSLNVILESRVVF
jgi:hypothetical protein